MGRLKGAKKLGSSEILCDDLTVEQEKSWLYL